MFYRICNVGYHKGRIPEIQSTTHHGLINRYWWQI